MSKLNKDMLTVQEFSEKANITVTYARQLLREKKINGLKVGKEWRISKEDANKYLGILTDVKMIEKEIYIKDLESKLKNYEMQIATFRNIVGTLENIVGM